MAEVDSIRSLYAWGIGAAVGLVALVLWFTPAQQKQPAPSSTASPERKKVLISALAPPSGLPAGATVMGSFPDVNVTVQGHLLPAADGTVQAEFEVPCAGPPGRVEVWTESPAGTSRWKTTPIDGTTAQLGAPQSPPQSGTPRDVETYRFPSPGAKAPPQVDSSLRLPPGTILPAGIKPMTPEQLKSMAQRYHGHP